MHSRPIEMYQIKEIIIFSHENKKILKKIQKKIVFVI
jgi:hypothetical protein